MALQFSLFWSLTPAGVISTLLAALLLALLSTLLSAFISTFVYSALSFIKAILSLNRRQSDPANLFLAVFPLGDQNTPVFQGRKDITSIAEKIRIRLFL
jgi:hypothetical protein